jgi:hypothetical protein
MKRLIHFPKTALSELVKDFGGMNRDAAIKGAQEELESMRGQADTVIEASIAALEQIGAAPQKADGFSSGQVYEILVRCDQIVTLAGTFGYPALDTAARCLCDLLEGLKEKSAGDIAAIRVHLRTLRLLAPGAAPLPAAQQEIVLSELAKILTHYGFDRASDAADRTSLAS